MVVHSIDNRVRRVERRIDLRACCHRAFRFLGMIEQLLWKLHCPGNIRDAPIKLAVDEISAASEEQTNRRGDDEIITEVSP